jgi:hypothetical protein
MTDLPTSFVAHLTTAAGKESVVLSLDKIQLEIWGLYQGVPWMLISDYITKGTVSQTRTTAGDRVIVNWSAVQFVTYDNPWENISREQAVKIPR